MPADFPSMLLIILLRAGDTVWRLGPYVLSGVVIAALLGRLVSRWDSILTPPLPLTLPLAALVGVLSPLPTAGFVPLVASHPTAARLTFLLASLLLNPQVVLLTLGALGPGFLAGQLLSVLLISIGGGLLLSRFVAHPWDVVLADKGTQVGTAPMFRHLREVVDLLEHVGWAFLVGALLGATVQTLLPYLPLGDLLSAGGLRAVVGSWLASPLYICGGSAVPLAQGLVQGGINPSTVLVFLAVGPLMRSSAIANLSGVLPRRALILCLVGAGLTAGVVGWVLEIGG